jgi:hypothetical protein
MIVGGGLPIVLDRHIVGGIGCSSGTVQQDREVASAGIQALLARLRAPSPRPAGQVSRAVSRPRRGRGRLRLALVGRRRPRRAAR